MAWAYAHVFDHDYGAGRRAQCLCGVRGGQPWGGRSNLKRVTRCILADDSCAAQGTVNAPLVARPFLSHDTGTVVITRYIVAIDVPTGLAETAPP
jgi:hypothetical protein